MEGQEKTVRGIKTFLKTLVTVVLFIIYMFPFYMIVLNAFKHKRDIIKMPLSWGGKKGFTTDNFVDAFQQMNFMNILKNSLIITCVSVFLIILFSSMAAYIFVRKAWKINQIIFMVMLFSMVIPFQVVMIPLISIYGGTFGILNHRATLIFMHLGFCGIYGGIHVPWIYQMAMYRSHWKRQHRLTEQEELRTFFQIVFPLLKPTTATLVILYALSLWNDYLLPSLILTDKSLYTIPIATKLFQGTYSNDMDLLMAALVMAIIPVIILYVALQKYIIAGVVAGAVKS